jgi:hypothetical protein
VSETSAASLSWFYCPVSFDILGRGYFLTVPSKCNENAQRNKVRRDDSEAKLRYVPGI